MERLNDSNMMLTGLSYHILKEITNDFSQKVGHGGYGEVYKGVYSGKDVAVKKLYDIRGLDDNVFKNELNSLMRVRHQNIVQLLGYCYEISHEYVQESAELFLVRTNHRILCFEYLHGGSLDKHLYDESSGHDWCTRYKIIKGICVGLNYLHVGLNKPIFHLDLKPANILLDKNMVPKIADFGLSRLFNGTHSHVTGDKFKGTLAYVPPEYIHSRHITDKYDIFSLGIIIIQIMTGAEGHAKYIEMTTPEQFIENVHKNWRNRLEATSMYVEEYSEQVKRCIKIASNCLEYDRKKRPTIGHIINELIQTETVICETFPEESSSASTVEEIGGGEEEVELSTIGPWGGNAGKAHTIKGTPHRLESVTIWSAVIVDALAFSYIETNGKKHNVGPWGGPGGSIHRIQFGPSEFLLEVSGTTGPYTGIAADVVKSVKLVTNAGSYGPFGSGGGTSFKTSVQNNGSIVGFFGRAATFVHAIGVYTSHGTPAIAVSSRAQMEMGNDQMEANFDLESIEGDREDDENAPSKIGPWGGNGGMPYDMKVVPHRMESMTVCSDAVVNSLALSYNDCNGKQQMLGPWGGPGGSSYTIRLGAFEHLKGIVGTFGPFDAAGNIITSLAITTNARRYGPFGRGGGTEFTVPVEAHGSVVGFFGRAGTYLDALGVYIRTY